MASEIPDAPLSRPDQDELGRVAFAIAVADLVLSAPPKGSLRLGVYGGWGEGKTSILKLVEGRIRAAGHHAVWIAPWATSTREQLVEDLVSKIAAELGIDLRRLRTAQSGTHVAGGLREAAKSDFIGRFAEGLAGRAVDAFFRRIADSALKAFFSEVEVQLKDKKLVVFVDDVDRVQPELVPQALLTLREVLDHTSLFYVLALAPDIVERGLAQIHAAWGTPKQFLEKIVELPLQLPAPTEDQWTEFVSKQIAKLPASPVWPHITAAYVPRNPRKAKLFFRFVSSLSRVFARFDDTEVDWAAQYICLLLILEFPDETRRLAKDTEAMTDLAWGGLSNRGEEEETKNRRFERHAPEVGRERFIELCDALRRRETFLRGSYGLEQLLTIHESPPLLTWRELEMLRVAFREKGLPAATKWIEAQPSLERPRAKALFAMVVKWRGNALDAAAEADLETELTDYLAESAEALDLLRALLKSDLPLGADEWRAVFAQAAHWGYFNRPDYYVKVRSAERQLLNDSLNWISPEVQVEILGAHGLRYERTGDKRSKAFELLANGLRTRLEQTAVNEAIRSFEQTEGVDRFWGEKGDSALKSVLFNPDSLFHRSPEARARLRTLQADALAGNAVIQRNFRTYFRMLTYAAFEQGGSFSAGGARKIATDQELIGLAWSGAVVKPLNHRVMGSLREDRGNLIKSGIPESVLPLPEWWTRLEARLAALAKDDELSGHD